MGPFLNDVVRGCAAFDAAGERPSVRGRRRFTELAAAEPRPRATAIRTAGSRGWDGVALVLVT